jgi:hypothetical protein
MRRGSFVSINNTRMKKNLLLTLSVAGFIIPNILVSKVSIETGNVLLWLNPTATVAGMYANDISTAFVLDLLCVVSVFFVWTYYEAKRYQTGRVWLIWTLTLLFGMAGTFPMFLYWVEKKKENQATMYTNNQ